MVRFKILFLLFNDRKIDCILLNDSHEAMAKTIALSQIEHASYFESTKPIFS